MKRQNECIWRGPSLALFLLVVFCSLALGGDDRREAPPRNKAEIVQAIVELRARVALLESEVVRLREFINDQIPGRSAQGKRPKSIEESSIPGDVSYSVIDEQTLPGIKRSLDVRLSKKVSEDVLRAIAVKLKAADPRRYERTFICYYLPDMVVDTGAWATSHFNPALEVRILGLTAEEEAKLVKTPPEADRKILGRWLDERPYVGHLITIFEEDGKFYMEQTFGDGSSGTKEMRETESALGRRFDMIGHSGFGDHWLIDSRGNLQIRDDDGLITTAKKVE